MPAGRAAILSKPNVINPGLALLQNSALWLDASDITPGAQWLRNKGTGGRSLDARLGSVGSAQIVNGALKVPGVMGNYASTPHSTALNITGDMDLRCRANFTTWGPSADWSFITKDQTSRSWNLFITPGRVLTFYWWDSSNAFSQVSSTATVSSSLDGTTLDVRMTFDADNGSGQREIRFYTKNASSPLSDNSGWTQLGTALTAAGVGSLRSTTDLVGIGGRPAANVPNGSIFRAMILNGINGSVVFDADFTTQPTLATSFVESSSNAATVTINSTSGVDTNDPLLLTHTGTNYLHLPGTTGNNATAPYISVYGFNGSFELVSRVSATDWTPAGFSTIIGLGSATVAFQLRLLAAGTLELYFNVAGAGGQFATSVAPAVTDGQTVWIKVTRNVTTGAVQFFTAPDQSSEPSSWTQLGTDIVRATQTLVATTEPMWVGASNNAQLWTGNIYRTIVRNGIGGTTVFDANFSTNTNQNSFTESSSNAATVTINRATSGRKAVMVTRPTILFGTDDYMEIADNALLDMGASQDFTLISLVRTHASWGNDDRFISKRNNAGGLGYVLGNAGSSGLIQFYTQHAGGSAVDTQTPYNIGTLSLISGVRSGSNLTALIGATGSSTSGSAADLSNTVTFRIGADSDSANFLDGEIVAVAVFRSALTTTELGQIATYYGV